MSTIADKRAAKRDDAEGALRHALETLEDLRDEIGEIRENLEGHFSETERYASVETAFEALDEACDSITTAADGVADVEFAW